MTHVTCVSQSTIKAGFWSCSELCYFKLLYVISSKNFRSSTVSWTPMIAICRNKRDADGCIRDCFAWILTPVNRFRRLHWHSTKLLIYQSCSPFWNCYHWTPTFEFWLSEILPHSMNIALAVQTNFRSFIATSDMAAIGLPLEVSRVQGQLIK